MSEICVFCDAPVHVVEHIILLPKTATWQTAHSRGPCFLRGSVICGEPVPDIEARAVLQAHSPAWTPDAALLSLIAWAADEGLTEHALERRYPAFATRISELSVRCESGRRRGCRGTEKH